MIRIKRWRTFVFKCYKTSSIFAAFISLHSNSHGLRVGLPADETETVDTLLTLHSVKTDDFLARRNLSCAPLSTISLVEDQGITGLVGEAQSIDLLVGVKLDTDLLDGNTLGVDDLLLSEDDCRFVVGLRLLSFTASILRTADALSKVQLHGAKRGPRSRYAGKLDLAISWPSLNLVHLRPHEGPLVIFDLLTKDLNHLKIRFPHLQRLAKRLSHLMSLPLLLVLFDKLSLHFRFLFHESIKLLLHKLLHNLGLFNHVSALLSLLSDEFLDALCID